MQLSYSRSGPVQPRAAVLWGYRDGESSAIRCGSPCSSPPCLRKQSCQTVGRVRSPTLILGSACGEQPAGQLHGPSESADPGGSSHPRTDPSSPLSQRTARLGSPCSPPSVRRSDALLHGASRKHERSSYSGVMKLLRRPPFWRQPLTRGSPFGPIGLRANMGEERRHERRFKTAVSLDFLSERG